MVGEDWEERDDTDTRVCVCVCVGNDIFIRRR